MTRRLAIAALLFASPVSAQENVGIGLGVSARGVAESQETAGTSYTRVYNVVEPHVDAFLPWQALRLEFRYASLCTGT